MPVIYALTRQHIYHSAIDLLSSLLTCSPLRFIPSADWLQKTLSGTLNRSALGKVVY